jgi:pyruvate formate lyase activating enzyme
MKSAARFLYGEGNDTLRCKLCPRFCVIHSGSFGACRVRGNKGGNGFIPYYGCVTALAADPIEKKPLYHFRPGSTILSIGFLGCNFQCPFCQNWHISQTNEAPARHMPPGDIVSAALHADNAAIAYTYSEPLVHIEYLLDCMALARRHGIANVLVTNGCINNDAAQEVLALTDAANIDLKCFSRETYANVLGSGASCGNFLQTTLQFIRLAREKNVHVEITTLVVPALNDSAEELDACAGFIASLCNDPAMPGIPWHLSAYHPDHRWNAPPTDRVFLADAKKRAAGKLRYVYSGNIPGEENDTSCPGCGALLVIRRGYRTEVPALAPPADGEQYFRCSQCGIKTDIHI